MEERTDDYLLWKIVSGEATEMEKEDFERWLTTSEEHRKTYEKVKAIWISSGRVNTKIQFDTTLAKDTIRSSIALRVKNQRRKIRLYWSAAASVVAIIGLGLLFTVRTVISPDELVYYATDRVESIVLPDSSHVWLNAHSTLRSPASFSKRKRSVVLDGEAFFEVTRDVKRPFTIETGNTVTEVLGTSFNISMDTLKQTVSVTVKTGKVAFYSKTTPSVRSVLTPNDMARYDGKTENILVSSNRDLNYLAWKTGILTFDDTPLQDVCNDLGRYYHLSIQVSDSISGLSITGSFVNEQLEDILKTIDLTLNVKATMDENTVTIHPNKPYTERK